MLLEKKYGGRHSSKRRVWSPFEENRTRRNVGGDRMSSQGRGSHGYADIYAKYLNTLDFSISLNLIEVGILKGNNEFKTRR